MRAVATNEPADVGIALARRAFAASPRLVPAPTDLPWFVQATIALIWADAFDEVSRADRGRPGREPRHRRQRAVRHEHDLAGVAAAAPRRPAGRRGRRAHGARGAPTCPRRSCTGTVAAGVLVAALTEQGDLEGAEAALRRFAARHPARAHSGAMLLLARGRLRAAQRRPDAALADMRAAGDIAVRIGATSPSSLPWRSEAALVHAGARRARARGAARREELELARAFGAPRALGVALRAAGVVIGGAEGEELLREAVATSTAPALRSRRARALVDLGALLRRANRRAEARELLREGLDIAHRAGAAPSPTRPRSSCAPPAPSRAARG